MLKASGFMMRDRRIPPKRSQASVHYSTTCASQVSPRPNAPSMMLLYTVALPVYVDLAPRYLKNMIAPYTAVTNHSSILKRSTHTAFFMR